MDFAYIMFYIHSNMANLCAAATSLCCMVAVPCFCMCCNSMKGWRTMLVIPELEREVKLLSESKTTRKVLINVHLLFFL
jgi:hypothetical protein